MVKMARQRASSASSSSSGFSSSDDDGGDDTLDSLEYAATATSVVPSVAVDVVDELEPTVARDDSAEDQDDNDSEDDRDDAAALSSGKLDALAQHVATPCIDTAAPLLQGELTYDYDRYVGAIALVTSHWPVERDDTSDEAAAAAETKAFAYRALRAALYARFQRAFPLTPAMYAQWLADLPESSDANDAAHVEHLLAKQRVYERALRDYESVALALQYAQFLDDSSDVVTSFQHRAETLEHALLQSAALHYTDGHTVWRFYRDHVTAANTSQLREQRVRWLFTQQLRVPLQQNDVALSEFRAWSSYHKSSTATNNDQQTVDAAAQRQHKRFAALYKRIDAFETRLDHAGTVAATESLEHVWLEYLHYVTDRVAPLLRDVDTDNADAAANGANLPVADAFVRTMYERAVAAVCLSATLWTKYAAFVRRTESFSSTDRVALYKRAVRNVSFDAARWSDLLLERERCGAPIETLAAIVEHRVLARLQPTLLMDAYHSTSVLLTYCDAHRRAAARSQFRKSAVEQLRRAFATATAFLAAHFPAFALGASRLVEYEATCVLQIAASKAAAAATDSTYSQPAPPAEWFALWTRALALRRDEADAWISFYHASTRVQMPPDEIRTRVFESAVQHVRDFPAAVLELWLAFEREHGTLEHVLHVRALLADHTAKVEADAAALAAASAATVVQSAGSSDSAGSVPAAATMTTAVESKKRKAKSELPRSDASTNKRAKAATAKFAPSTTTAAAGTTTRTAAATADAPSERRTHGHDPHTNAHTLFVSNLSKDVTQDELTALFRSIDGLKDVRLVVKTRAHHVKSRGMAYVQFTDASGVAAGLKLHGHELKGKAMSVEQSKPPAAAVATGTDSAATASQVDRSRDGTWKTNPVTLYVGGLVRAGGEHIDEVALQVAIQQALQSAAADANDTQAIATGTAAVTRVSILKDRRGKPKDYGLVEFATAEHVAMCMTHLAAIQLALGEQITLKPSRFSIDEILHQQQQTQKPRPPKQLDAATRSTSSAAKTQQRNVSARPAGESAAAVPSAPRQRVPSLGLMPRALRRKPTVAASSVGVRTSSTGAVPTTTTSASRSSQPVDDGATQAQLQQTATVTATDSRPKTNDDFRKLLLKQ